MGDEWVGKMVTVIRSGDYKQRAILRESEKGELYVNSGYGHHIAVRHVKDNVFKQVGWAKYVTIKKGELK